METDGRWGCYVHVPWCRARCPYCHFYVVTEGEERQPAFVEQVLREHHWRSSAFAGPAHTLYLGGGTPSRLQPDVLTRLLRGIATQPGAEISAEVNPEDLTPQWLQAAQQAGLNRISLGVQTLGPAASRRLGRAHTRAQAQQAMQLLARSSLRSWSTDLIFAVPGQTLPDLDADLQAVIDGGAPHVSIYGLTIEPDTAFARARARGSLPDVAPELWRRMYDHIVQRLTDAGLQRYEVSNFARPSHRCVHNELYWTARPYMGLGPGAHGYAPDGTRTINAPDLAVYLDRHPPPAQTEHPTPRQAAADLVLCSLRGVDGLDLDRLQRTGHRLDPGTLTALVKGGLAVRTANRLSLADAGFPVADGVVRRLLDTLMQVGAHPGEPDRLG
ncbi:MAG: radical SAM family heme chaperone HemW [Myxococcales bacterium]|nr:radical SAM family heme chaperone HemW [Myxococcales bacterium]